MLKIKFSHWYSKMPNCLRNGDKVQLLEVFKKDFEDLGYKFIWYDTLRRNSSDRYNLPEAGPAIILLLHYHNDIFTTVRRYTDDKYNYYTENIGNDFVVIVDE